MSRWLCPKPAADGSMPAGVAYQRVPNYGVEVYRLKCYERPGVMPARYIARTIDHFATLTAALAAYPSARPVSDFEEVTYD